MTKKIDEGMNESIKVLVIRRMTEYEVNEYLSHPSPLEAVNTEYYP